ncbi:MAG TPA: hypothetical protein VKT32_04955 [Chthonomonadaceae bacterium]|nr:hypothetical protein [Chthonomonadaceae bacterium]
MNLQGIAGTEPVALAWGEAVWRACWQGGIFLLAVWGLCRLLPRLPAALQCWLWWLACLKLVLGLVALPPISLPLLAASGPARAISSPAYAPVPFLPASGGTMSAGAAPSAGWWLLPSLLWSAGVLLCLLVVARQSLALCALRREATSLADSAVGAEARRLVARPLGYGPMRADWARVFDAFFFTDRMFPSSGDGWAPAGVLKAGKQLSRR